MGMDKQVALNQLIEALRALGSPDQRRYLVEVGPASYDPSDFVPKAQVSIDGVAVGSATVEVR